MQGFGTKLHLIDLYQDGFSPILTAEELGNFYKGITLDSLVKKYQKILLKTDKLVVVFPIWFNEYPAILKGFFDRVCLPTFAFEYIDHGVAPKLTNIKSSLVITTSNAPTEVLQHSGNIIENQFIGHILKGIGILSNKWMNFGGIQEVTREQKESLLKSVRGML